MSQIHPIDVILHKRDGKELSREEMQSFVAGVVDGSITDARIAAWLMAVFQRGLSRRELADLTAAMRYSGETFDSSGLGKFTVDKHSTGGVGDKTSLLIAPIVAAAGLADPMISGRSLGHTGGTLDKMETIPGYNTQLSLAAFGRVLAACGASMIGQTENLVPADRKLYALRDHTGTVESPDLICASIMSKKLASGLDGLVLDVKTGSGAFLQRDEDARHLAELLVATGEASGTKTVALLTRMDEPLGRFAGNWVEVWECVDVMRGRAHPLSADLVDLSTTLAGLMLLLGGKAASADEGKRLATELLEDGSAYAKWMEMVRLHGGDVRVFDDPASCHKPAASRVLHADCAGTLTGMDCRQVGWAVQRLGAGREVPGGAVAAHAGIAMHVKLGDRIAVGQPLITMFAEDAALLEEPERMLRETLRIADAAAYPREPLVRGVVTVSDLS